MPDGRPLSMRNISYESIDKFNICLNNKLNNIEVYDSATTTTNTTNYKKNTKNKKPKVIRRSGKQTNTTTTTGLIGSKEEYSKAVDTRKITEHVNGF